MKIVDLSQSLYDHMPVYPGNPDVIIEQIQTFDKDGWNMKRIQVNLHDGTHVNIPIHGVKDGKNLNSYTVDNFFGKAELYKLEMKFYHNKGIIFSTYNIDKKITEDLIKFPPKFIGLSAKFEFDITLEKLLLEKGIISFENLVNTEKLPKEFTFYGVPLNIKEADGSPVRTFAII
ncbi:MAG: hypothetical protein ACD_12C00493G0006 [uncultured bacterium]|nr:MAG: hypothetical protein ACD_12C00493G0006 [uncultured bacterium]